MSPSDPTSSPSPISPPTPPIPLLRQREIEARIVAPIVTALSAEIGEERALTLIRGVITKLARDGGGELARSVGDASLSAFATCLSRWTEGGALELRVERQDDDHLDFDVTRCRYAEMYRALGLEALGSSLSCLRDFALIEGFSPDLTLSRTQTILDGAPFCDFRFRRKTAADSDSSG